MKPGIQETHQRRALLIFSLFTLFFSAIALSLFRTQILEHNSWSARARNQQFKTDVVPAKRGNIISKDGFILASSSYYYNLFANPSVVDLSYDEIKSFFDTTVKTKDTEYKKELLSKWLELLASKDKKFVYLIKDIDYRTGEELLSKLPKGFDLETVVKRSYPDTLTYSHLLGFVGIDKDRERGYFGIEGSYDGDLSGKPGFISQDKSALGSPILFSKNVSIDPIEGGELTLTIDRNVQNIVYIEMLSALEKYGAKSGSAIVLNPKTGEILSMVNVPSYDIREYSELFNKDPEIFINKSVSSTYEPGSVIKALTVSGAVDMGLVNENTTVSDNGKVYYGKYYIDNWDGIHHGNITVSQVLSLSDNIGAAQIGGILGKENLYKYFRAFNFGERLGVDLQGEESGTLRKPSDWQDIDLATASFGQGISATPLQVVSAFGAIANDGILMKPYVVSKIVKDKKIIEKKPEKIRNVISKESSAQMVDLLTKAVSNGEAKYFVSKKYVVAGKTGTAQIFEDGKYLKDSTNATFVGFLPNYKEFVMLVKLERPTSSTYASETSVPTWMRIAEKVLLYYGFPPDK